MSNQLINFWKNHDQKILFFFAFILIAIISFNAGRTYENTKKSSQIDVKINPLKAANPKEEKILALGEALERKGIPINELIEEGVSAEKENKMEGEESDTGNKNPQECVFVGSKNSDKYHLPNCRYAANIKLENRVCFSSKEEAENKGYKPAGCCIK